MNCIIELNNKLACKNCGHPANMEEKKCGYCNMAFDEDIHIVKPYRPRFPKRTMEEITKLKIRNNEPLCVNDFISVEKLKELGRIRVMM